MGKSRTSPLSKTGSSIGIGSAVGGVGSGVTGGASATSTQAVQGIPQPQQVTSNQPASSIPTPQDALTNASKVASIYGNNTVSMFNGMSDDQMAQAVKNSKNVDMPNHIADISDATQNFTFANGLNAKPTVLNDADFDTYIKQNKIGSNEYLIREVDPVTFNSNGIKFTYTADDVTDMLKTSDINYIGGKRGGQVYGAGTYFAMGGFDHVTHYGSGADGVGHKTIVAVFDKSKAKAIYKYDVDNQWQQFSATHSKTAKAVNALGTNTMSIKALLMGYNVITSNRSGSLIGSNDEYYNIIDRSALVIRASNRK